MITRYKIIRIIVVHVSLFVLSIIRYKIGSSKTALIFYERSWEIVISAVPSLWLTTFVLTAIYAYMDGRLFFRDK